MLEALPIATGLPRATGFLVLDAHKLFNGIGVRMFSAHLSIRESVRVFSVSFCWGIGAIKKQCSLDSLLVLDAHKVFVGLGVRMFSARLSVGNRFGCSVQLVNRRWGSAALWVECIGVWRTW